MPNAIGTNAIGPNFLNELVADGLLGLPFSWGSDGSIEYSSAITSTQKTAIAAVYASHDPNKPNPRAAAAELLTGGITVTSTSTPSLNGTYAAAAQDEINITGLQVAIANNVFPGFYRDVAGNKHTMTGPQFTSIATAVLNFAVAVENAMQAALAGGAWIAPSSAVTIS